MEIALGSDAARDPLSASDVIVAERLSANDKDGEHERERRDEKRREEKRREQIHSLGAARLTSPRQRDKAAAGRSANV